MVQRLSTRATTRSRQSFLLCHAVPKAMVESFGANRRSLQPFGQTLSDSIDCYFSVGSHVSVLLKDGCPSAILRGVIVESVCSVDRMFRRRLSSHVCEKSFKRVSPAVAHTNASGSVGVKRIVRRRVASGNHVAPRSVLNRFFSVAPFTVTQVDRCAVHTPYRNSVAPTRHGFSRSKHVAFQNFFFSTRAQTVPFRVSFAAARSAENNPSPKFFTC